MVQLTLFDLDNYEVCHGYQNGCVCSSCLTRQEETSEDFLTWLERTNDIEPVPSLTSAEKSIKQPWERLAMV